MNKLKELIYSHKKPKNWREGQFVFNIASEILGDGIIKQVQFDDGIDCFYDDSKINNFINACYNKLNKN